MIFKRKFSGACNFQVQEMSSEPSGNSGVEMSPGTRASMTMFVFDGEQTGIQSKLLIKSLKKIHLFSCKPLQNVSGKSYEGPVREHVAALHCELA